MLSKLLSRHTVKTFTLGRAYSTIVKNDAVSKLTALRSAMTNVDAFVVPSEDAHQSEYTAECDNRRAWISGFTGSAGCAIITKENAALFTDGRYFLQASQELDAQHWTLMKQGLPGVPTWQEYLVKNLPPNSNIGIDPSVITLSDAQQLEKQLASIGSKLVFVEKNPVDQARKEGRPCRPAEPIQVHPIQYAGKSVKSKLNDLRQDCQGKNIVMSLLDEIAWLLNLRGSDIHCSPVFFSYCLVTPSKTILYIQPNVKLSDAVKNHLSESGVQLGNYNDILNDLQKIKGEPFIVDSDTTNMSLLQAIGSENIVTRPGPSFISMVKAIKNESELNCIRDCHKRDAVALVKHFAWLSDTLVKKKEQLREFEAATHLESMRQLDPKYVGLSFDTIAATGPNGAIIHYQPHPKNSAVINPRRLYLCDSGAQYLDGTTDVTRTFLFDDEAVTAFQKRAFTRVLQSHISIDQAVFPHGTTGYQLDSIARMPLWKDGLNFRHGVGHGVGAYLNVHEGPHGIGSRLGYNSVPLLSGMLVTNEPGYYEEGQFGIRIENILTVKQVQTPYRFGNMDYYGFDHVTFVPLGKSLMDLDLLNQDEKLWINEYHQQVRDVLEPLISSDNKTLSWLERETEPLL